jgi:hypothetical protein
MMEKKLTNSGPFMESTGKHSIYPPIGDQFRAEILDKGEILYAA